MYSLSHLSSSKKLSQTTHHPLFISLQSSLLSHCSAEISQWPLITLSLYSLDTVRSYFFYFIFYRIIWLLGSFDLLTSQSLLLPSFSFFFPMTTYSLNFLLTSWLLFLHLFSGSFSSGQLSNIQIFQGLASASYLLTLYLFSNLTDFRGLSTSGC